MKTNMKIVVLIFSLIFFSCSEEKDNSEQIEQERLESIIIGDWITTYQSSDIIYRFQKDGTVLIGKSSFRSNTSLANILLPEDLRYNKALRFYYKSNWYIDEYGLLDIEGEVISLSYSRSMDEIETQKKIKLIKDLGDPHRRNGDQYDFYKVDDLTTKYEYIKDLTEGQYSIDNRIPDGLWIKNGLNYIVKAKNGIIIEAYNLDKTTGNLVLTNTHYDTPYSHQNYSFKSQKFNNQTLGREFVTSGTTIYGNYYSTTYELYNYDFDNDGNLIMISFREAGKGATVLTKYIE